MKDKNIDIFAPEARTPADNALGGRYRNAWTEESMYWEKKAGRQVAMIGEKDHMGSSLNKKKIFYFFIFLICTFFFLGTRIVYLQIIQGGDYRASAENNRQRVLPIVSERGLIYDRNDIQLTKNIPNFALALVPQDLPRKKADRGKIITKLAEMTNKSPEKVAQILEEYGSYSYESIVIAEDIDYDHALSILLASADLPGIQIQRASKRLYLNDFLDTKQYEETEPHSLSHVLGYTGKLNREELDKLYSQGYLPSDSIGKSGVEKSYESFLRGTYGKKRIEVNAVGKEQSVLAEEEPKPGFHLKLAIDVKIQENLERILNKNLKASGKKRASGIVMNPQTGEVLALVSLPAFDNNDFSGGISREQYKGYLENEDNPLFNRSLSGTYPSGSIIKPAIALAALQEGIINASTNFLSTGGLAVSSWFFPDWKAGGHGRTNVRFSLAWSVNTFYYYIGGGFEDYVGLGVARITDYLREFGFSKQTGVDLPGEGVGFLPSKEWKKEVKQERWYVGDTYNLSIGQGDLLVTPLQIANYTAVLANGGTLYKPHIVKSIIDPISKEEQNIEPEILNENFIDKSYINIVRLGMKDCVDYGSCRRLSLLPFSVAGKTGTAQWSSNKENHSWFTSFAPFDNPKITVTILVEEGGGGSELAGPIAFDFYNWWWGYTH